MNFVSKTVIAVATGILCTTIFLLPDLGQVRPEYTVGHDMLLPGWLFFFITSYGFLCIFDDIASFIKKHVVISWIK